MKKNDGGWISSMNDEFNLTSHTYLIKYENPYICFMIYVKVDYGMSFMTTFFN
jgi:hypothetical protein